MDDEAVARSVQNGDEAAYGELVERYQEKLLRYGRKFLVNADDVQDIVQDVFIKAYENIQSFDASRRFSPWIYRIAHNEFVNGLKRRAARRIDFSIDLDTFFPAVAAPETADGLTLERDLRETLDAYLEKIDPKYREVLVLYYLEGMNYKEISDILQIPVSTAGVRLARARALLQKAAGGAAL